MDWIEIAGSIAGFIYIFLGIKANKWMCPVGLVTSVFYVIVFFNAKFYADMSLQFYYIFISIVGWYWWIKGGKGGKELVITKMAKHLYIKLFVTSILIFLVYALILTKFTDSQLPYWDSLTTSLSIVASWMLARKMLEQWILWVIIDLISMFLYIYKGLYPTSILFLIYTVLAVVGYYKWKKEIVNNNI